MIEVIMTGCYRSGSSALAELISHDPGVFIMNELVSEIWGTGFPEHVDECLEKNESLINQLSRKGIAPDDFRKAVVGYQKTSFEQLSRSFGFPVVGDKLPDYVFNLEKILNKRPAAKVIFTVRDCHSYIESALRNYEKGERARWTTDDPVKAELIWLTHNTELLKWAAKLGQNCFVARYEKTVKDPGLALNRISQFLGYTINVENPSGGFHEVEREKVKYPISYRTQQLMELLGYDN